MHREKNKSASELKVTNMEDDSQQRPKSSIVNRLVARFNHSSTDRKCIDCAKCINHDQSYVINKKTTKKYLAPEFRIDSRSRARLLP